MPETVSCLFVFYFGMHFLPDRLPLKAEPKAKAQKLPAILKRIGCSRRVK